MLRGIWQDDHVYIILPKSLKMRTITLSNQLRDLLIVEIGPMDRMGVITTKHQSMIGSNYIIASIDNYRLLLRRKSIDLGLSKLRGTVSENIGEAFISFAAGVIKQIDGALSVV